MRGRVDRGVTVFRGIPFAAAPVGALRFRRPQPPDPWPGVRDCRDPGPASPQNATRIASRGDEATVAQSEDCLRLDLWTAGFEGVPRPVLVFVHGGAFVRGAASDPGTRGRRLARGGDMVVVSLQYRLGALGFLDPADLPRDADLDDANLGLLDQIAALEWVRAEIDAFGGDPGNVTVFGTGAGATSVACLLSAKRAHGLFRRAILASGSLDVDAREDSTRRTRAFLAALGLKPADARKLVELPVDALLGAQRRTGEFRPTVDGALLAASPLAAARAGTIAVMPTIIGTNRDEARRLEMDGSPPGSIDRAGLAERLRGRGLHGQLVDAAIAAYEKGRPQATAADLFYAIETDRRFRVPSLRLAESLAACDAPVHVYEFAFPAAPECGRNYAFHGLEEPFVFGTRRIHPLGEFIADGPDAKLLSRRMRDAWTAFVRSGDPHAPLLPAWPAYTPVDRSTLVLDANPRIEKAPRDAERAFWSGDPSARPL